MNTASIKEDVLYKAKLNSIRLRNYAGTIFLVNSGLDVSYDDFRAFILERNKGTKVFIE